MAVSNSCFSSFIALINWSTSAEVVSPNPLAFVKTLCNASFADDRFPRQSFLRDWSRDSQILLQAKEKINVQRRSVHERVLT